MRANPTPSPTAQQPARRTSDQILEEGLAALGAVGGLDGSAVNQTVNPSRADILAAQTKVYLGRGYNNGQITDIYGSVNEAYDDFYSMTDEDRQNLGKLMYSYGLVNDPSNYDQILGRWQQAVDEASKYYNIGKRNVDPWDALGIMAGLKPGQDAKARKSQTTTTTSKTEKQFSPGQIKALVTNIFQQQLGRDPSAGEIARYGGQISGAAAKNPSISRTTQTVDPNGNATVNTEVVNTGFQDADAQVLANDRVQVDPEYGAYQAATTYMNALQQALGGV